MCVYVRLCACVYVYKRARGCVCNSVCMCVSESSEFLCRAPVIEKETVYVCMYFSPFCRGIILTFVLVGCTQREKL